MKALVTYHGKQDTKLGLQRGAIYRAIIEGNVAKLDIKPHVCYFRTEHFKLLMWLNN